MKTFGEIHATLGQLKNKKRVGVIAAQDEHTLEAVVRAAREQLISPVLVGDQPAIEAILDGMGGLDDCIIYDEKDPVECAKVAAKMVRGGELDCVMKGRIETGALMKVMVDKEAGIRKSKTMSLLAILESPYYHKLLGVTDSGMLTYPTLEQKRDMVENAVSAFRTLGVERPKVAVLAAIEHVNPKMKETVEAAQLKEYGESGELADCIIEGPISYDLSVDAEAAEVKGFDSPVAGDADILVVPDIVSGNILTKSLLYTGGAKGAGALIGALVPIILTSRSTSAEDKHLSIMLNAVLGSGE